MTWLSLPSFWKPATEHRRGISTAYRCAKSSTVHAAKPSCPIGASASPSCAFPRQRCLPSPWPAFHHRPTRSPRFRCGATERGGIRWGGRSGRIPAPASSGTPSAARRPAAAVATGRPAAMPRSAGNSLFRFGPDQPPPRFTGAGFLFGAGCGLFRRGRSRRGTADPGASARPANRGPSSCITSPVAYRLDRW